MQAYLLPRTVPSPHATETKMSTLPKVLIKVNLQAFMTRMVNLPASIVNI